MNKKERINFVNGSFQYFLDVLLNENYVANVDDFRGIVISYKLYPQFRKWNRIKRKSQRKIERSPDRKHNFLNENKRPYFYNTSTTRSRLKSNKLVSNSYKLTHSIYKSAHIIYKSTPSNYKSAYSKYKSILNSYKTSHSNNK